MRLNAWQRLWIVAAALWTPIAFWQWVALGSSAQAAAVGFAVWATPLAGLYMAGVTVAWVRRGFAHPR